MKLTPLTYAKFPTTDGEKLKFYRSNLRAIAKLLKSVPNDQHNQKDFGIAPDAHSCATRGCALGLAAMYNIIPGLQYYITDSTSQDSEGFEIEPIINGEKSNWPAAMTKFFGDFGDPVFFNTCYSKEQTIVELRKIADRLTTSEIRNRGRFLA